MSTPKSNSKTQPKSTSQKEEKKQIKFEKVQSLEDLLKKPGTKYIYARIIRKTTTYVILFNKNNRIQIGIFTVVNNKPVSTFDVKKLRLVSAVLQTLETDLPEELVREW